MLPIMRRPRFWAWTLTLTATLLAVVWVGSMRWGVAARGVAQSVLSVNAGQVVLIRRDGAGVHEGTMFQGLDFEITPNRDWGVIWWFGQFRATQTTITAWHAPLWPFVLLTGVPGVWMMVKTRKHSNPNTCPACGYDRTGLPQSPTGPAPCPECGKRAVPDSV